MYLIVNTYINGKHIQIIFLDHINVIGTRFSINISILISTDYTSISCGNYNLIFS